MSKTIDIDTLPEVPEAERPRDLPVNVGIRAEDRAILRDLGWVPVDVRLLPSETVGQRVKAIFTTLEGARLGTITLSQSQLRALELEMKAVGLGDNKPVKEDEVQLSKATVDELLCFGKGASNE